MERKLRGQFCAELEEIFHIHIFDDVHWPYLEEFGQDLKFNIETNRPRDRSLASSKENFEEWKYRALRVKLTLNDGWVCAPILRKMSTHMIGSRLEGKTVQN